MSNTYLIDANQRPAIKNFLKNQKLKAETLQFLNQTFYLFIIFLTWLFLFGSITFGLLSLTAKSQPAQINNQACNSFNTFCN
jgi:hypothetical protein